MRTLLPWNHHPAGQDVLEMVVDGVQVQDGFLVCRLNALVQIRQSNETGGRLRVSNRRLARKQREWSTAPLTNAVAGGSRTDFDRIAQARPSTMTLESADVFGRERRCSERVTHDCLLAWAVRRCQRARPAVLVYGSPCDGHG